MTPPDRVVFDGVIVVGAGLAGLSAALAATPRRVMMLSPVPLGEGAASAWAQGGVAVALADDDDPRLHAADTIAAGADLCVARAVNVLTHEGPESVRRLANFGAPFDRAKDGSFVQSLEAAHSRARVARVGGDGAGRAIMAAMIAQARRAAHIEIRERVVAVALMTDSVGRVRGVLARGPAGMIEILAPATILATGGLGGLYAVTTDPATVRGEGLAIAALAGARILDPEFVQFHPTAIDVGADPAPLATEALRGEGARLINASGDAFMAGYDAAAELAPRDIVARAIATERRGGRGAFLDAREAIGAHFPAAFPAVFAACMAAGIDPRTQPIPVLPAAHYHMGGVATDLSGATSLPGLYAAGECAATGVHGANRLASNSLLEAAVFGHRTGRAAREATSGRSAEASATPPPSLPAPALARLRVAMSRDAGVVRDATGLNRLLDEVSAMEIEHGLALPIVTARMVAEAALARRESRGAHYRSDFPATHAQATHTDLTLRPAMPGGVARRRKAA